VKAGLDDLDRDGQAKGLECEAQKSGNGGKPSRYIFETVKQPFDSDDYYYC
jgi:hypothetical protein